METYQPLYLKHRPQTLGQLVGQGTVVKTLTNAIDNDRIAHAYLFTGPRGCGKTSSARILAKSLNCEEGPTAEPCMTCTMCEEIKKGISPAVMEIDAASNNSVDDARVIIERAPLVAQGGRFKLYIIDECHMLTKEAFNALLKTIEEPPPNVIFILATTEEHKVPPTIISRCQRLMFRLVNHEDLCNHLRAVADREEINIADEAIELIARRSGGGARDALGLLDQASLLASPDKPVGIKDLLTLLGAIEEDVLLRISEGIANRDAEGVLSNVHQLLTQGREPSLVALELAKHFLNLAKGMHLANTKNNAGNENISLAQQLITGSQDYIDAVINLAKSFDGSELTQIVMELDRLEQSLRRSTQPAMALEVGLLAVCHRHDIMLVKELSQKVEQLENAIASGNMPVMAAAPAPTSAPPRPASAPPAPPQQSAPPPAYKPPAQAAPEPDNWAPAPKSEMAKTAPDQNVSDDGDVEPPANARSYSGGPSTRADDDDEDDVEPQAPPPAPKPAESAPRGGGSYELDEFWSNLMSEMQSRHLPSYALVSQQGFPLSFHDDEFVIGVLKEHFQKTVENKIDKIQVAAQAITGKTLHIKVKVTSGDAPGGGGGPKPVSAGRPAPAPQSGNSSHGGPGGGNQGGAQGNHGQALHGATASERVAERSAMSQGESPAGTSHLRAAPVENKSKSSEGNGFGAKPASKPSAADLSRPGPNVGDNPNPNQLMIKEAYKLFEGPGSRFVG